MHSAEVAKCPAEVGEFDPREALFKSTANGVMEGAKHRMKGYKDEYSAAEIKDLVAFIRSLKP